MSKIPKRHVARRDRLRPCEHSTTTPGLRVAARYGSWPTEVCCNCGAWRTRGHTLGQWSHAEHPTEQEDLEV